MRVSRRYACGHYFLGYGIPAETTEMNIKTRVFQSLLFQNASGLYHRSVFLGWSKDKDNDTIKACMDRDTTHEKIHSYNLSDLLID